MSADFESRYSDLRALVCGVVNNSHRLHDRSRVDSKPSYGVAPPFNHEAVYRFVPFHGYDTRNLDLKQIALLYR